MQWPVSDAGMSTTGGVVSASSLPATLTASATPHAKGAYTELHSGTTFEGIGLLVLQRGGTAVSSSNTSTLLDIALGAAGSEQVLCADIPVGFSNGGRSVFIPVRIPSGSHIAARIQSVVVSKTMDVQVIVIGGGWVGGEGGARCTAYGANESTSAGTQLTAPGSVNTKGAYLAITASSTNPLRWLIIFAFPPNTASVSAMDALIDVAVGGAGSEAIIAADLAYNQTAAEAHSFAPVTIPANLPAGTRLSARYAGSITTQAPHVILIGVD